MNRGGAILLFVVLTFQGASLPAVGGSGAATVILTNPVTAVQYADAVVIRIEGFDVLRRQYPQLRMDSRLVGLDGIPGETHTYDLSPSWEQPSMILRKAPGSACQGILIALRNDQAPILQQYIPCAQVVSIPVVPVTNTVAVIEPGAQMGATPPVIPHPDLGRMTITTLAGQPSRVMNATAIARPIRCATNYPSIASQNCAALTRQTDDPANASKRSLYVALASQLFNQTNGAPTTVVNYLCEVPLDPSWLTLNGTNDLRVSLATTNIKVHATDKQYQGWTNFPILGEGGGLGQITMAVDAEGNIYYPNVPSELVRFRVATADFEIPPIKFDTFMTQCLPPSNSLYGSGGPHPWRGEWSPNDARYVAPMNLSNPGRMFYLACFQRIHVQGYYEWAGLFSVPTGSWTDPAAFSNEVRLLVGSWTNAPSFFPTLPTSNSNRRVSFVGWPPKSHGNTIYLTNYPGTESGTWRVDMGMDGSMTNFGTPATLGPGFYDGYSKPSEVKPYNAQGWITWQNYGQLTMTRAQLSYCLTGTNSTSYTGSVVVTYDPVGYMVEHQNELAAFSNILASSGGPSLAPAYMATAVPGATGQILGVTDGMYYISRFDTTTNESANVNKTFLNLHTSSTNVTVPLAAGLGPYANGWQADGASNWLHIAGYIGLTRLLYSTGGVSSCFTMDNFGAKLASHTMPCDQGAYGQIKWYRYLVEGLNDRFFLTGRGEANRGGNEYSGGLLSYDARRRSDTLWTLNHMSRCYDTSRLRTRIVRKSDDTPIQEFCIGGSYNDIYGAASTNAPTNTAEKIFFYTFETNAMKDVYGFSQGAFNGSDGVDCLAYSPDRRYLVILRGSRFMTFDPQENRFVDGRNLTWSGTNGFQIQDFSRPDYSLIQTPDNRLVCYATSNTVSATNALFIEIGVSPEGLLSFTPGLGLQATNAAPLVETYGSVITFLPDLTNHDGSYDLFIGMSPDSGKKGTSCRLLEDFVPPRLFAPPRQVSVFSKPVAGVGVGGTHPGSTPYGRDCTNGQTLALAAPAVTDGRAFIRWEDLDGNGLAQTTNYSIPMTGDVALVAVFSAPAPSGLSGSPPPSGTWSTNRVITVQWAADAEEYQISGYAYLFTNAAGASAPATLMTTGTNATSASLPDGVWWFVVRSVDRSGNWGPSVEVGPFLIGSWQSFPFEDAFESYGPGASVAGTNGWSGEPSAGIVTALTYQASYPPGYPLPRATHSRALLLSGALSNALDGAPGQSVGVDFMTKPARGDLPANPGNSVQMGLCIDTQGVAQVWHFYTNSGTWTQRWTALGNPPFGTTQWIRVSVALDYSSNSNGHTLFRPALNGIAYPTAYGVADPTNLTPTGSWYVCANSPAAGGGGTNRITVFKYTGELPCLLDDFTVTPHAFSFTPPGTLLMIR